MGFVRSSYLFLYNFVLSGLWGHVLYLLVAGVLAKDNKAKIYETVKQPLQLAQTAALLEIVHSALGVVRSPFFATFIQVLSRIWCLWGIIFQAPETTSLGSFKITSLGSTNLELNLYTLLFSWSVTEVLRYSFFAVKEVITPPYFQLWLRYTAFIPFYPLGVASELAMAYLALPIIKAKQPLTVSLPNKYNFGFDYYWFCWLAIFAYVPGLPFLYLYMLKQRKKLLGGAKAKAKRS